MTDENRGSEGGMRVDAELVRQLAELLNENELTEVEVQDGERRIVVKRQLQAAAAAPAFAPAAPAAAAPAPAAAAAPAGPPAAHPGTVKSPMVGTVYLSGEPGAKPFVAAGQTVREGETLVIVEAMKVMNPITAPRGGRIVQLLVANAQPVEFDQPLVVID